MLEINGKTLLQHSAENLVDCAADKVVVIAGSFFDEYKKRLTGCHLEVIRNQNWREGMAGSIRVGVEFAAENSHAVLLCLADQMFVSANLLDSFIEQFRQRDKIIAGIREGKYRNPALFPEKYFDDLLRLQGDKGAQLLLRKFSREMIALPLTEKEVFDVDTVEDYNRLLKLQKK